jgi:putative peptidoglycan lipid II flippase
MSLTAIILLAIPITIYVLVFAEEIVTVLLRRGAFDADAASLTALTLRFYSLGLFFHAYTFINAVFFSAFRMGGVLLRLGIVTLMLNAAFNWSFLALLKGPQAIALSTTVTMAIVSVMFLQLLSGRLERGTTSGLGRDIALVSLVSGAAGGVCLALAGLAAHHSLPPIVTLGVLSSLFGGICLLLLARFRTAETGKAMDIALEWARRTGKRQ